MLATTIAFLVMLNPFALFVFLEPIRRSMERANFNKLLVRASMNSAIIFIIFYLAGDIILTKIFQINFEAFRIFGGIVIFSFAYLYIIKNRKTLIHVKKNINDLAIDVSVPFMVGAGTISLSILLAEATPGAAIGITLIIGILAANYLLILGLGNIRSLFKNKTEYFDKYMDVTMRINIFLIGAIGVNMIITGITNL